MSERDDPRPDIPEVITVLAAGMAAMHEFYVAAIEVGFTKEQAFRMVLEMLHAR